MRRSHIEHSIALLGEMVSPLCFIGLGLRLRCLDFASIVSRICDSTSPARVGWSVRGRCELHCRVRLAPRPPSSISQCKAGRGALDTFLNHLPCLSSPSPLCPVPSLSSSVKIQESGIYITTSRGRGEIARVPRFSHMAIHGLGMAHLDRSRG
jgi:hypothetical protein